MNLFAPWLQSESKRLITFCPEDYSGLKSLKEEVYLNRPLAEQSRKVISSEVFRNIFNLPVDLGINKLQKDEFLDRLEMSPRLKNDAFAWLKYKPSRTYLSNWQNIIVYRYGNEGAFENAIVISLETTKGNKNIYLLPHPTGPEEIEPVLQALRKREINDEDEDEDKKIKDKIISEYGGKEENFPIIGKSGNLIPVYRQLLLASRAKDKHVLLLSVTSFRICLFFIASSLNSFAKIGMSFFLNRNGGTVIRNPNLGRNPDSTHLGSANIDVLFVAAIIRTSAFSSSSIPPFLWNFLVSIKRRSNCRVSNGRACISSRNKVPLAAL